MRLVNGDLDDTAALDRLCAGTDRLFHVAGWYKVGSRTPMQGRRVNVDGTRHVLEAARRNDVPRVVHTSTLAVNSDTGGRLVDESYRFPGRHLTVYDETKAAAHDIGVEYAADGLAVVIVMPGVVYGPGDTSQVGALLERTARGAGVSPLAAAACAGRMSTTWPEDTCWPWSMATQGRTCWPGRARALSTCCAGWQRSPGQHRP